MYRNTTNTVKISDLSFCEVAVEQDETVGGVSVPLLFGIGLLRAAIRNQTNNIPSLLALDGFQLTNNNPAGNVQQYVNPSTNATATVSTQNDDTQRNQTIVLTQNNGSSTSVFAAAFQMAV